MGPARGVEYRPDDPGRPPEDARHRLLTSILDPAAAPADELAPLYARRWEFETALDELLSRAKVDRLGLHDARHTAATLLLVPGVPPVRSPAGV